MSGFQAARDTLAWTAGQLTIWAAIQNIPPRGIMNLQQLLGDQPASKFVEEHYQRLPFSMTGTARPCCELGTWESLGAILAGDNPDVMVVRRGQQYDGPDPADSDSARRLADDGFTILIRHAERHDARIAELARSFQRSLGGEVNVHMYATPAEQFGFGWHYDAEEVFIVQTTGVKEYSLRKNTVNPWPLEETLPADMRYEREIMPLMRCRLSAGDWLYIPSGYWHMAAAEESAISLAIGVMPRTGVDVFDSLRPHVLDSLLWRQRLPTAGEASPLNDAELIAHYRQLAEQWADDLRRSLTSDRAIKQWIAEQRFNETREPTSSDTPE
ncbi:MAG: hypothetical protein KDA55_04550 [Planctomycetales bacterium]|nr:hypothetical protein [Planctomycetales bacterium]MCA9207599.1 hypothetical protein [Planctomycetales bacterium]